MAEREQGSGLAATWEARFQSVTRLDEPDDDEVYEVTFELLGHGTNGTVHVSLAEVDEALIIGEAGAQLEQALRGWLRTLELRHGTGPAEATQG